VGFGADVHGKRGKGRQKYLSQVEPDDLLKYGLIPEFIGRLPVIATLDPLDENALFNILTEPRNAIVKQYQKLLGLEGVELEFEDSALRAVVERAMERGTGARALRSIIENIMLDVMYQLPSRHNVSKCIITRDTIMKSKEPIYLYEERKSA
jgi:ATP-dependent Clp protease ATP-binding subunit ClpX